MRILSIFAGREKNLKILVRYLQKALKDGILDQIHFWNFTKQTKDEDYLHKISNPKKIISLDRYKQVFPQVENNSFEMNVQSNSFHIKVNDMEFSFINPHASANTFLLKVSIDNNVIDVYADTIKILSQFVPAQTIDTIAVKADGVFDYLPTKNQGFYLMDVNSKEIWSEYYEYYADTNDVIIKCDDDIVFIDLCKLQDFCDAIEKSDYDILFANTINNGVSAYYQQEEFNLFPTEFCLEYPNNGLGGSLWESGKKAERVHNYFLDHIDRFLSYQFSSDVVPINTRFSINFFIMHGKNWHKIKYIESKDDEHFITVQLAGNVLKNGLYPHLIVSHLSFFKQVETNIDTESLLQKYTLLADTYLNDTKSELV